jgi:uroporphyrinogen decarboxylase
MSMTARERVIAQIEHRETDYIPYTLGFEGDVAERLDAYYGGEAWRALLDNAIRRIPGPNLSVVSSEEGYYIDPFGSRWRTNRRPFHLEEPALKRPSLKGYAFPDVEAGFAPDWREKAVQDIREQSDHFTVTGFGFGLFERTWTLRGFDEMLMDAAGDPDFYDELVEAVTQHQLAVIDRLLELPVDGIMFSDDWGYQQGVLLGPQRWRRFIKPRLARMYARVHAAGKYTLSHCCGSIADILPDIIEIGLDVLESVQPEARGMNPYELKRQYGAHITFWGGLGSQSTIPFGAPAEIKAEVRRLCREMGRGGGYILTSAKALQPETPNENAAAVLEAFLEQAGVTLPKVGV